MNEHAYAYQTGKDRYIYEVPMEAPDAVVFVDIAIQRTEVSDIILTVRLVRDPDGDLSYQVMEHADDDADVMSNVLPEYFPPSTNKQN